MMADPKPGIKESLLAVDMGLRTGLALFNREGRLTWYRSQHYGSARSLKSAVYGIFKENPGIAILVIEGGGPLADIWMKEAGRRQVRILQMSAEDWRKALLLPREQKSGIQAKSHAQTLARKIIDWSGARRPTSLRHDAAEAILAGMWGAMEAGWITDMPNGLPHRRPGS